MPIFVNLDRIVQTLTHSVQTRVEPDLRTEGSVDNLAELGVHLQQRFDIRLRVLSYSVPSMAARNSTHQSLGLPCFVQSAGRRQDPLDCRQSCLLHMLLERSPQRFKPAGDPHQ